MWQVNIVNALTRSEIQAENYPFCTIEPNTGMVAVPDTQLETLAKIANSTKIIPTLMEFVDIAGLVSGASKGEGLGNQFLGHIRSVQAIAHMTRCFEDSNITHVAGKVDPLSDLITIETELALADIQTLEKAQQKLAKLIKAGNRAAKTETELCDVIIEMLNNGKPLEQTQTPDLVSIYQKYQLLCAKPALYVANVNDLDALEENTALKIQNYVKEKNAPLIIVNAAIEAEIAGSYPRRTALFCRQWG